MEKEQRLWNGIVLCILLIAVCIGVIYSIVGDGPEPSPIRGTLIADVMYELNGMMWDGQYNE